MQKLSGTGSVNRFCYKQGITNDTSIAFLFAGTVHN